MDLDRFEHDNHDLERRLAGLRDAAMLSPFPTREELAEATSALGVALDQLRAARSSLRHQEDEIRISRMVSEAERRRYRELFDEAPIGYVVTDPAGRIEEANRAARDLLGRALPGDPVGRSMAEAIAGPDREGFFAELDRLAHRGRPGDWEARLPGLDGEPTRVAFRANAVPDWSPEPFAFRWTLREVEPGPRGIGADDPGQDRPIEAGRLAADPGGEAEAARVLDWVENLDLIFWEAAPDGRIRYLNRRAGELLGYPADRWLGRSGLWGEIVHGDDRDWLEGHHRRCIGQGRGGELEYRLVAADGRVLWFRESTRVALDEAGRVEAIRGTMWEIGRRKKVERQLNVARRELADRLGELTHLNDLGRRLWESRDPASLLVEIVAAAAGINGADVGLVRLIDPARGDLEVAADFGLTDGFAGRFGRRKPGDSACWRAIERQSAVVVEDVVADPGSSDEDCDLARLGDFRAFQSTPLIGRSGQALGTIVTGFFTPHRPSDRQVRMVEEFARIASDFVENSCRPRPTIEIDHAASGLLAVNLSLLGRADGRIPA